MSGLFGKSAESVHLKLRKINEIIYGGNKVKLNPKIAAKVEEVKRLYSDLGLRSEEEPKDITGQEEILICELYYALFGEFPFEVYLGDRMSETDPVLRVFDRHRSSITKAEIHLTQHNLRLASAIQRFENLRILRIHSRSSFQPSGAYLKEILLPSVKELFVSFEAYSEEFISALCEFIDTNHLEKLTFLVQPGANPVVEHINALCHSLAKSKSFKSLLFYNVCFIDGSAIEGLGHLAQSTTIDTILFNDCVLPGNNLLFLYPIDLPDKFLGRLITKLGSLKTLHLTFETPNASSSSSYPLQKKFPCDLAPYILMNPSIVFFVADGVYLTRIDSESFSRLIQSRTWRTFAILSEEEVRSLFLLHNTSFIVLYRLESRNRPHKKRFRRSRERNIYIYPKWP
jgi:hypothetical protein